MNERDLDLAVTVGSPLDERQYGQDPFGAGEVLSRGAVWLWWAVHRPDLVPVKPRSFSSPLAAGPLYGTYLARAAGYRKKPRAITRPVVVADTGIEPVSPAV